MQDSVTFRNQVITIAAALMTGKEHSLQGKSDSAHIKRAVAAVLEVDAQCAAAEDAEAAPVKGRKKPPASAEAAAQD